MPAKEDMSWMSNNDYVDWLITMNEDDFYRLVAALNHFGTNYFAGVVSGAKGAREYIQRKVTDAASPDPT